MCNYRSTHIFILVQKHSWGQSATFQMSDPISTPLQNVLNNPLPPTLWRPQEHGDNHHRPQHQCLPLTVTFMLQVESLMMEEEDMVMITRWNIALLMRDEENVVTAKNFKYINHWHDLQRGEEGGGKKQDPWNPLHHPCLSHRQQQVGDDHQYQHHHRFNDLNNPAHLQCQDKSIIVMFPIKSWS